MPKTIIFRADGNSKTGLGHLYRLFSLVEIVKDAFDLVFLTNETSTTSVIPDAYNKLIIPKTISIEDEPQWLATKFLSEENIIIADGYQFNSQYQKQLKELHFTLIYIDDLAKEHMYADLVINHSPYIKEEHFIKQPYTNLALGTQYALLRPLFLEEAKKPKTISKIDTAFVCFGGADPYDLSFKSVKALLEKTDFKLIHVVLGAAYQHQDIYDLKHTFSHNIHIHKNLSEQNLVEVMQKSNFAIVPASTILYEICCVKMPVLSGFYIDNQELIYKGFLRNGAIYQGGNMIDYTVSDFAKHIDAILKEQNFNHVIQAQNELFDDKIASRHLNLISELC